MIAQRLIFAADDSSPQQGFYSVTLRRNCAERALGVICNQGLWNVYMDGEPYAAPSQNWKDAFGRLYQMPLLKGSPLTMEQYKALVTKRLADRYNGVDLQKPINHNETTVTI